MNDSGLTLYRQEKLQNRFKYIKKKKIQKLMPSFTLFKSVQWAGLESWRGRFWTPNLMFDTPALDGFKAEAGRPYPVQHILWIQKDFIQ